MSVRVSVQRELLQRLFQVVHVGRYDVPFGEISKLLMELNQDIKDLKEDVPEKPEPKENPA